MFTAYEKACLLALIQAEKESDAYQNRYTEKMREILNSAEEKLLQESEQQMPYETMCSLISTLNSKPFAFKERSTGFNDGVRINEML